MESLPPVWAWYTVDAVTAAMGLAEGEVGGGPLLGRIPSEWLPACEGASGLVGPSGHLAQPFRPWHGLPAALLTACWGGWDRAHWDGGRRLLKAQLLQSLRPVLQTKCALPFPTQILFPFPMLSCQPSPGCHPGSYLCDGTSPINVLPVSTLACTTSRPHKKNPFSW